MARLPTADENDRTLIDDFIAQQGDLTATSRFSRWHDHQKRAGESRQYQDLIPLSAPRPGEQYAFEVDLDKCSGCKACDCACHSLNGLDEGEAWRETGLLFSDDWRQPFQQTVTSACHHCADPACLNGCPVLAYDKDAATGIVRHLDDQCIGCQYCVIKCPYEVPKYSAARGIVRKCDMCANRLAVGEAPACVQACPSEAIRISVVTRPSTEKGARMPDPATVLPGAPSAAITLPTTRFISKRPLPPQLLAGDHAQVKPAPSHLPLTFMLVLTQLAAGASVGAMITSEKVLALAPPAVLALALGLASLHLGKPLKAWRAFLGWRRSWFSREIIVFSAYFALAAAGAVARLFPALNRFQTIIGCAAAAMGIAGVVCSAMIYVDTHREFWNGPRTFGKFLGTTALLGVAAILACVEMASPVSSRTVALSVLLVLISLVKLSFEHRIMRHLVDEETPRPTPLNKSARLFAGPLGLPARLRIAFGIAGGVVLPLIFLLQPHSSGGWLVLSLCCVGEWIERYLFFVAVAPRKMPGGVAT
jgi:Fe-S-cluster-containing dehydrogenase component/DMSO reductase anchor subunit